MHIANFENLRWQTAAILKCFFFSISQPLIIRFWRNLVSNANIDFENGHVTKSQNFSNPREWTDAILKIVFGNLSVPYCPTNAEFGVRKQNYISGTYRDLKKISKIQDGGRPPFWKWFSLYLSRQLSDFDEIWCADAQSDSKNCHVTILQF